MVDNNEITRNAVKQIGEEIVAKAERNGMGDS
jgi:hypothetical protein